ncbi:MAG: efflux transporter periplasmic adaptor subunit [Proteobacteria bacterium]|nr:MAG: efflux transporter periplasmic adaptor subunit [Pseudomonadota bacterium]PIE64974.1 MAG: efflux transporter periplasmic adaptor subunit [Desulfobacterales bacterium]
MKKLFPLYSLVIGIVLFLTVGCKSNHEKIIEPAAKMETATVTISPAIRTRPTRQVEVMGSVQARNHASIAARISGNITELNVNLGSRVKKGDALITISAGEISAKLLQAQAQFEQVDRNLKRERKLLKKKAATSESVKTLEESRRIAEAVYNEAKTMLSYTTITAPFDGVITRKNANIGDLATPGKPLLQLEDSKELQVIADVPEALVLDIALGDKLELFIPATKLNITGTVAEIAPSSDPRSRTAPVKIDIETSDKIRSGQFCRVNLPGTHGEAIIIPDAAILPFGQMDRVFIEKDGKAHLQLVKTGLSYDGKTEILAGINQDDRVIVTGNEHLKDGQPVSLK